MINLLLQKRKQGKIFVLLAVIITLLAIVFLILISSDLKKASDKVTGSHQKAMINTLNKRDSVLLFLDEAALLAKKNTLQSELAANAGYFEKTDVGSQDFDITGYGTYIYPLISNGSEDSFDAFNYEQEYLKLFRRNLLEYTSKNSYLNEKEFLGIFIKDGKIFASAEAPKVELLITSDELIEGYFLDDLIMNINIPNTNADKIINEIKKIDINTGIFTNLKPGDCSMFISRLLDIAYSTPISQNPIKCIPNNAWDVAACYLDNSQNDPSSSRVVYAGKGLKYEELVSIEGLLKPGDFLFTTSSAWKLYSGYNFYNDFGEGFDNFCFSDSITNSESQFPAYCVYDDETNEENNIYYENYPIVTHIFMYLDEEKGEYIIANLFNEKRIDQDLQTFVNNPSTGGDGVRIIIRPNYT